jgi:hypothetical protein
MKWLDIKQLAKGDIFYILEICYKEKICRLRMFFGLIA